MISWDRGVSLGNSWSNHNSNNCHRGTFDCFYINFNTNIINFNNNVIAKFSVINIKNISNINKKPSTTSPAQEFHR